jgi:AcrR family transcriptional regulator
MRADAVKNRSRILETAEAVFAAEGVSVPIDVVADKAGVGVGTVYRHFPTKEALFEAIVMARVEELTSVALEAASGPDAGAALFTFLNRMADEAAIKHDLFDALASAGIDLKEHCAEQFKAFEAAMGDLVARAIASGDVRDDVGVKEVMGLIMGVCMASDHSNLASGCRQQLVSIVCDGLRAH